MHVRGLLTVGLVIAAVTGAGAQTVSEQDIVRALSLRPAAADDITGSRSLDGLLGERGITPEGGDSVPSIDIRVNFDFDSISLGTETLLSLNALGNALTSEELAGSRIEIVGHTDGKGSDDYNADLSKRRAQAVVRYLVENFGVDQMTLLSAGAGESRLLLPDDPENELNRRVEIRNVSGSS